MKKQSKYYLYDPDTRQPSAKAPRDSCDSQIHIFDQVKNYPVASTAAYHIPSATFTAATKMHKILGITRGVIVQSTAYGYDHSLLMDVLDSAGDNYRGCGIVGDQISDLQLNEMNARKINGARFNLMKMLNMFPSEAAMRNTVARVANMGWYIKIQPGPEGLLDYEDFLNTLNCRVIIDHFGRVPLNYSRSDSNLDLIERLIDKGNFWLMLSNGHKISNQDRPWKDIIKVGQRFVKQAPERMLWGSDWPHPISTKPVPNDADLFELLYSYVDNYENLKAILVENPREVFNLK